MDIETRLKRLGCYPYILSQDIEDLSKILYDRSQLGCSLMPGYNVHLLVITRPNKWVMGVKFQNHTPRSIKVQWARTRLKPGMTYQESQETILGLLKTCLE